MTIQTMVFVNYVSKRIGDSEKRPKFGLWGVFSYQDNRYIKTGDKGKMNALARLLNENE